MKKFFVVALAATLSSALWAAEAQKLTVDVSGAV
jgi:hypothetical protein